MLTHRFELPWLTGLVLGIVGLALVQAVRADELLIRHVQQEKHMHLPKRGLSMAQVKKRYGAPVHTLSARGGDSRYHPCIRRWVYRRYTVYFEHHHVIHSVLNSGAQKHLPATK